MTEPLTGRAGISADLVPLDPARPLSVVHLPGGLTVAAVSADWLGRQPAERVAALMARHLAAGEGDRAATFRSARRRTEWLAGRLAAKHAVRAHTGARRATRAIRVAAVESGPRAGKPFVDAPVGIGISHSGGLAVAVCGPRPVGIDLELDRVLSPALVRVLRSDGVLAEMSPTLRWACKEAVLKSFGFGLRIGFREVALTGWRPDGTFTWSAGPRLRDAAHALPWPRHGWAAEIRGYAFALVW
ncbi:4'-phosphopantetheinyl transferase superfamily protein [Actinomadura sp. BRA 177]|uniref:4'-phosphopantetheinyl transferase family protein n=1 Tax=Actinomadura sp. BRA 177 TaxID=2745202 RepID=UPI00159511A5|nr:4'-phosphopantetheinyl transferase superfamily protein [Actinomadura sp. BRA 177]NVI88203.1 4'-phosphopantetheinyl transferase superfamily protein [Actinomadura sp. BRA 177]